MRGTSTEPTRRALLALCTVLLVVATVVSTAVPAEAKHHSRKPRKLWHQYPLNVAKPSLSPSAVASATPSAIKSQAPSHARKTRAANTGGVGGKLAALLGGAAILGAALFLLMKRAKPPTSGVNLPQAADTSPNLEGRVETEGNGKGYNRAVIETASEPWMGAAPSRVRLQLEDGRSLEGFTRESSSTNPELVILDVVTTFDPNGNEAPPKPSDSFILRSEIESMQRMDDS
jgi:hypothetical protein